MEKLFVRGNVRFRVISFGRETQVNGHSDRYGCRSDYECDALVDLGQPTCPAKILPSCCQESFTCLLTHSNQTRRKDSSPTLDTSSLTNAIEFPILLSLGAEAWTRRIATAPQFHENHVFTEVFAFNLLHGSSLAPDGRGLA